MNTISPYTIRCFNPLMKGKKVEDSYSPLGSIGQFDMYEVFKSYITGKGKTYHILKATEQIYSFSGFKFNDSTREIRGVVRAGSYGSRTDLVNIKTGNIDFKRLEENAEVLKHYVRLFVPAELNEGVVLLHNQKNVGVKTLIYELLREEFASVTGRVLQMNPLSYEKAFEEWKKATTKEIKLIRFRGMNAIEDQIKKLGHDETEHTYTIKASRKKNLGALVDYLTPGTEQNATVEILAPLCAEVKTVVEMHGRKRTFRLGSSHNSQVCEIDVDEKKVTITAGNPNIKEFDAWCKILLNEFLSTMYPGMDIKV
ncbi:Uncharacterized protein AC504_3458 [Pseudomonas syringae pv. maculicola]|uniref:Uncharacterized protein n=1 Tax=Pseudomonas savastanoi pv. glycinea TaxID=318 RepID=A0A3M3GJF4_PSESG|nr:hypothetical protein [Pseudomonas savastanoi]KPB85198.1 Uncharacterized protein AC504_3458 [Pseudomonas syringae pv. maculicola]MBN4178499.1 hypothetical protein [Pseudomonas savastanoi pv. phaseolicola]RMM73812.1 hypothetical protein ALQ73_01794 [Pseudomonas savastanoi pv. glycinea]RMR92608.1 hypothetical protein ALP76_01566 [Pseudomonas savastanoi pv. glycinea]